MYEYGKDCELCNKKLRCAIDGITTFYEEAFVNDKFWAIEKLCKRFMPKCT